VTEYRIICVVCGSDGGIEAVGYSESGNAIMYDGRWTLEQARQAIEDGHRLYTVSPLTGERADLELADGSSLLDLPDCH
jgi:ketol-acid reductoisomerase